MGDHPVDTAALKRLLSCLQAARDGDFRKRLPVGGEGLSAEIALAFNEMVERNQYLASELARVRRVVGREGRLTERLNPGPCEGSWEEMVDDANSLVEDLVRPTVEVGRVLAAVAQGDLSQQMDLRIDDRPLRGEFLRMGRTVNGMVDQLSLFNSEVTRVAREVGTEGKLGGQARVRGVAGSWKDLTDSVNTMASRLTNQVRDIADVTTAVARGDLSKKVTVEVAGEMLALKNTVNTMVDQLSSFADEVTRVAREVGTDGRLGGQARVRGVAGTWKDLTDSVNFMAGNLTAQVRDIAAVTTAVARGDLSKKVTVDVKGELLELKETINTMVDQLSSFAAEVTRVAREVGSEGQLGGQAEVPGVAGTWKDLTDSVNFMAGNLTSQVRNIAAVTTAVARGDLTQKITVEVKGELLELKETINTMVDQLSSFAAEVTRVAREVGSEGRLGGQAEVTGVSGTWKALTDSVNFMAGNLTSQVRNIAAVTTAVAGGDLSKKITAEARGEILELKNTINTMVDQLSSFADEVTRVAREVGTEGKLGAQAKVSGVSGTWRDLTDNVNFMADNLTSQVRNIAQVATAVAQGDLGKKIEVDARGEILELKETINTMVDQLRAFGDEVTRVAREVGTEGRLGGQAKVPGVSGVWKDLTQNVNFMGNNLTEQVRNIAQVTTAVAKGDLSQKITVDARGEILALKNTINTMVDQLSAFADEVTRVAREVGTEGQLGGQARVKGVSGTWKDLTDNVNGMASNLTSQVRSIAGVATAVAKGDLSQKVTVEVAGEMLALKNTINTMVDQLSSFAAEVTRVAREVGTEGRLGGQAEVAGVSGTWKDLTDNVNFMANNLTSQVRNIAQVTTAVAQGDLSKKIDVDARGEILELKNTINTMVDQLSSFAAEVTRVAREVGTEGRLGGRAEVEDISGTWKRLTESVNELAGSLTTQVRALAEVATAVARGDLSRQITVDAKGELSELRDNINQMIDNLRETTRANQEQDWLKTNLARISALMQGRRDLSDVAKLIMSEITPVVSAQYGAFFLAQRDIEGKPRRPLLELLASYGFRGEDSEVRAIESGESAGHTYFRFGEGVVGQAAVEKQSILMTEMPSDYLKIVSGLGSAPPASIIVLPVLFENQVLGVIELASFHDFSEIHRAFLDQLMETVGVTVNTIIANSRTESLLRESQRLAEELKAQQEELRRSNMELEEQAKTLKQSEELLQHQQEELRISNAELEDKAAQLADQNRAIEIKNSEIETARRTLQERAEQLTLSSKYKSEFLANMSHELRTPLNSLLILAKLLADNPDRNLTSKQVEFAQTIYNAGSDLLQLINDILDLSKVEAGKMDIHLGDISVGQLVDYVEATFRPLTVDKGLQFSVEVTEGVPPFVVTDEQRLQQILRNLLSNAVKFTESGMVKLEIGRADGVQFMEETLQAAPDVIAFTVSDTGIGIPADKLNMIFEAFAQADGTTSRKYGGTGLGLSISREIGRLLGGEIHVESEMRAGSRFTLFLPARFASTGQDGRSIAVIEPVESRRLSRPRRAPETPEPAAEPATGERLTNGMHIADDRGAIRSGDRVLLVVGADESQARIGVDSGRAHGFKVVATVGADPGFSAARTLRPDAILLAGEVAGSDGALLLDLLKRNPDLRHVPVMTVDCTGRDEQRLRALRAGALAVEPSGDLERISAGVGRLGDYLDRDVRHLLVVQSEGCTGGTAGPAGQPGQPTVITDALSAGDDLEITRVETISEAVDVLTEKRFDCMVIDAHLRDQRIGPLLEAVAELDPLRDLPVLVHTETELPADDESRLVSLLKPMVARKTGSADQLRDAVALFLHRQQPLVPVRRSRNGVEPADSGQAMFSGSSGFAGLSDEPVLTTVSSADNSALAGVTVLIVDDDVRNVFALTSVLEQHGIEVLYAENGREGIDMLQQHERVALVLMDVMMPEMDGYATTEAIRKMPQFSGLPIVALTAKAMKGDREKSISAGASDYVTKPVDIEQLLSVMRSWLQR